MTRKRRLVSLLDFENRERVFPGIDSRIKFCLLTLGSDVPATMFTFFVTRTELLADERRRFNLSPEDIALINPKTRTCPIFRSQADAEFAKKIYRRMPVLTDESTPTPSLPRPAGEGEEGGNPWAIRFLAMFHMANDSGLFRTHAQLREAGGGLEGMVWTLPSGERRLPLYEAKMIHHFDHCWAAYGTDGESAQDTTEAQKQVSAFRPMPRYWVSEREVEARLKDKCWSRGWLLGWRDICRSTDERTVIAAAIPRAGTGDTLLLMFPSVRDYRLFAALLANLDPPVAVARPGVDHGQAAGVAGLAILGSRPV